MSLDIRPNPSSSAGVTGGLVYKGEYNVTTNSPNLTSSSKGDFYIVNPNAGTLAGVAINVGDHIVFNEDAASPLTSAMFDVIDNTDAVASVNGQTGVVSLDTDNISEGSSNLYYTNARFDTQLGTKTTDNLTEGSSNLYYTNARFDTQLGTKDTDNLSEGSSNLYYTNARFDTQLGTKDTGDLSEGSNLYYTNARADARIGAANLTDLNDVNYTAGASINGYVLEYVHANTRWEAKAASGGGTAPDVVTDSSGTNTTISTTTGIEEVHLIDNGTSAVTISLPSASTAGEGYKYQIKRLGTATVTIDPDGSEQIDNGGAGVAITLDVQFESVTIVSNNANWFII